MIDQFCEAAVTGEKLTHMTHTEDMILRGRKASTVMMLVLKDIVNMLSGIQPAYGTKTTIKFDGSPSILAASDFHGDRFVATKGLFAKDPKIARTEADCDVLYGHAPELARKMKWALAKLDQIDIPANQIWQGDFLFDSETVFEDTIDGEKCVCFHPNTIVYSIPLSDPLAKRIKDSKIGIAWHTRYTGDSLDSVSISFDVSIDEINNVPDILCVDAKLPLAAGNANFTAEEAQEANSLLATIASKLNSDAIDQIANQEEIRVLLETFMNASIKEKQTQFIVDPDKYASMFRNYVTAKMNAIIDSKKQDKTKEQYTAKKEELLNSIEAIDIASLISIQKDVVDLKELCVKKLNKLNGLKTFLKTDKGYIPTGQEGFAASDADGNIIKLVSRLEFSYSNFSKDVIKGWMSDKRLQEKSLKMDEEDKVSKGDAEKIVSEFLLNNDLEKKTDLKAKRDLGLNAFHINVTSTVAGEKRSEAIARFSSHNPDASIGLDGSTPIAVVDVLNIKLQLNFKDRAGEGGVLDANDTAQMESLFAQFMYCANTGINFPSYEEAASQFSKIDQHWYEGFITTAHKVKEYLAKNTKYVFCREDSTWPSMGVSIHTLINDAFRDYRGIFGGIGSKKDAWNPSDVYACKKSKYNRVIQSFQNLCMAPNTTLNDINSFLIELLLDKVLVGISLKKPTKPNNIHLEELNVPAVDKSYEPVVQEISFSVGSQNTIGSVPRNRAIAFKLTSNISEIIGACRFFGSSAYFELKGKNTKAQWGKVPVGIIASWCAQEGIVIPNKAISKAVLVDQEYHQVLLKQAAEINKSWGHISIDIEVLKKNLNAALTSKDALYREWVITLPSLLAHLLLWARCYKDDREEDFLNDLIKGSRKESATNAPYIKIS